MGITIGDSLSVVAILLGVGLSTWALIVALGLLVPNKALRAQRAIEDSSWRSMILGLLIILTIGVVALALASSPNPAPKLLGIGIILWVLSHSAIGVAGLANTAAERIKKLEPEVSAYRAYVRGAGFLVVAGFLPLIGWFAFGPLMLVIGTGAGFLAVFGRQREATQVN